MPDARPDESPRTQSIPQALKTLTGKSLLYGSALLAIAAIPGAEMTAPVALIAGGLGVEALGSLLDRLAFGEEEITPEEISEAVELAIAESGIEELLSHDEFQHEIARLLRQTHLLRAAVEQGELNVVQALAEQYSTHQAMLWELQDELEFVIEQLEGVATQEQGETIIANQDEMLILLRQALAETSKTPAERGHGEQGALTDLHLEYLRRWFGKSWGRVNLADMLEDRDEEMGLLDVYVPLQVDLNIIVKVEDYLIVDWWVKQEKEEALREREIEQALTADLEEAESAALTEMKQKVRVWAELVVDETAMQSIIDGIQRKIQRRREAGSETKDGEHSWFMEAQDAASVQPRFVLLGAPGGGKSSFLRHLTLCLAGEMRRACGDNGVPGNANLSDALNHDWLLGTFTPIYVEIRDLVRRVFPALPEEENGDPVLPTCDHFWRYTREQLLEGELVSFNAALRRLCADGEAILLLDGLDEAPQAADPRRRRQIKALVASLVDTYPDLRIIITSRPHAYRRGEWPLSDFGRAELEPLEYTRLQELAKALFPAVSPQEAEQEAEGFIKAVRQENIELSMRGTPLFFTMLAALWLNSPPNQRHLPQSKAELYRRSVDLLLDRWTRRRAPDPSVADNLGVTPEGLRAVLEALACAVHEQSDPNSDTTVFKGRELAALLFDANIRVVSQDISDYLSQHAGILVASAPGEFHFVHRSFQEHLAACELVHPKPAERQPPVASDRRFPNGLIDRVRVQPDLWENVVLLAGEELLVGNQENKFWRLLTALVQPYLQDGSTSAATGLALQMTEKHKLLSQGNLPTTEFWIDPEQLAMQQGQGVVLRAATSTLTDIEHFPSPEQRDVAGRLLGSDPHPGHDTRKGVSLRKDNLPDIDWVLIPEPDPEPGQSEFIYQESERRTEPDFWVDRHPVTRVQFKVFLDADDGFRNPEWWRGLDASAEHRRESGKQAFEYWNHPRERVSWYDAIAFCRWLTEKAKLAPDLLPAPSRGRDDWRLTLPTEWQWEKAARGFEGRQYPWGDDYLTGYANINERHNDVGPHHLQKTTAVGMYEQGASPAGVLDMSGNVWEWCLNEHGNPEHIQESGDATRVLRGGSWDYNDDFASARFRFRGVSSPLLRNYDIGFRLVVSASVPI